MAIELTLKVDDKGRATLVNFGGEVGKLGRTTSQSATKMTKAWTKVERKIGSLHNRIKRFATGIPAKLGLGVGIAGAIAVVNDLIKTFTKQEASTAGLIQSMKSMNRFSDEFYKTVISNSQQLQKEGIFGDEAIIEGTKFLMTYRQITDDLMPRTMRVMADLSALTGGDMASSANILGKAAMGMVGQLSRYGITLSDAAKESKDFKIILGEIEQQVGGQNRALANAAGGGWKQFSNILGDAKERLGGILNAKLEPRIRKWTTAISDFLDSGKFDIWADKAEKTVGKTLDSIQKGIKWVIDHKDWFVDAFKVSVIAVAVVELANVALAIGKIRKAIIGMNTAIAGSALGQKLLTQGSMAVPAAGGAGALAAAGGVALYQINAAAGQAYQSDAKNWQSLDLRGATFARVQKYVKSNVNKLQNAGVSFKFENGTFSILHEQAKAAGNKAGNNFANSFNTGVKDSLDLSLLSVSPDGNILQSVIPETTDIKFPVMIEAQIEEESFSDALGYWESYVHDIQYVWDSASMAMANTMVDMWSTAWDQWFGKGANTIEKLALSFGKAFTSAIIRIGAEALANLGFQLILSLFAGQAAFTGDYTNIFKAIFGFHTGGPVEKLHDGGMKSNERLAKLEVGEYVTQKSSVNPRTRPTIEYINRTGNVPGGGNNININRGDMIIQGSMDGSRAADIERAIQESDDKLAEKIERIIESRELVI